MKNQNKALPEVEVELGGETFLVTCSFEVLLRFQRQTGKNPFESDFLQKQSPEDMVTMIWAAIQGAVPQESRARYTPEWVASKMGGKHMRVIGEIVNKLFQDALPEKSEDAEAQEEGDQHQKKA